MATRTRVGTRLLSTSPKRRSRWGRFLRLISARLGAIPYMILVLSFLYGRALPQAPGSLLGIALAASFRGVGLTWTGTILASTALLFGTYSSVQRASTYTVAACIAVTLLVAFLIERVGQKVSAFLGAIAASVSGMALALFLGHSDLRPEMTAFWLCLCGVMALIFGRALHDLKTLMLPDRTTRQGPVFPLLLVGLALLGLDGILFKGVTVSIVVTVAAILLAGRIGGGLLAAVSANVFGVVLILSHQNGVAMEWAVMSLITGAILSGLFHTLGRLGSGIAFVLGVIAYAAWRAPDASTLVTLSVSVSVGVIVSWLIPQRLLSVAAPIFVPIENSPTDHQEISLFRNQEFVSKVRGMADVLREVSYTVDQPSATTEPAVGFGVATEGVCQGCSLFRQCWETDSHASSSLFSDLLHRISSVGPLNLQTPPEELERHCIHPSQIALALNLSSELTLTSQSWRRRVEETRSLAGDYVRNTARLLERLAEQTEQPEGEWLTAAPVITVSADVAKLPKRGTTLSGDSHLVAELGHDRQLLLLSDGMGVGLDAASESKQAIHLVYQILQAGLSVEVALNTVNSMFLSRMGQESFVTIDLAILDLTTGRTEFVKVGAAPSFVKRNGDVTLVRACAVPVGIVEQLQVEPEYRTLRPGDTLVMITDGIWDVAKTIEDKDGWIISHLRKESSDDPEEIAERLLARALEMASDAGDDMTVLVARLDGVKGTRASVAATKTPFGAWTPARPAPRLSKEMPPRNLS